MGTLKFTFTIVSVAILIFLSHQAVHACSCAYFEERFCGNIDGSQNVILVEVKNKLSDFSLEVDVLEKINGEISEQQITVTANTSCSENLNQFNLNDTLILALLEVDNNWDLFGSCGKHFLHVKDGQVLGQTNDTLNTQSYRGFVDNFDACAQFGSVSVNDIDNTQHKMTIMPNPTSQNLSIQLNHGMIKRVDILNSSGQSIMKLKSVNSSTIDMLIADFQRGIYFVQVHTGDQIIVEQFLKL